MTAVFLSILAAPLLLWVVWGFYVAVMGLYRLRLAGRMTPTLWMLGAPYWLIGLVLDAVGNVFISAVFFELPRELLITARLKRHMAGPPSRRQAIALWICRSALDPLDPTGKHC